LHILLDYLIDQDEDRRFGDLNFCSYYSNDQEMVARLAHFYRRADLSISALPNPRFHRLIIKGLLAIYCSDQKVHAQNDVRMAGRHLAPLAGTVGVFFYVACWSYRRMGVSNPQSSRRA
jgi:tetraprenyl-beta-curcumene synthase